MLRSSDVCVVVPCHNEVEHIFYLVQEIRGLGFPIIVINDGSTDPTRSMAEKSGATVLNHPRARGKGAAIQTGLQHVLDSGYRFAILMDGDQQHSPRDLAAFMEVSEDCKLVIGNRMNPNRSMPWLRRIVNKWMSNRLSNLTGFPLPDSQCGYRRIELETWKRLNLQTTHFEAESEMACEFVRATCYPIFIPIEVIYKKEKSKIRPIADSRRWFSWYFRYSRNWRHSTPATVRCSSSLSEIQ
ncbi:MAG: hypothetical protein JWN25_673 [Verrucomicrobiales bacterium]|nr:hypothetical protein [Verrucomicrobiales bacterium]